jgi:hypothetical protein
MKYKLRFAARKPFFQDYDFFFEPAHPFPGEQLVSMRD